MTWHSTPESAAGLTHPCEVVKILVNSIAGFRWYVDCENCGRVGHAFGFTAPEYAERLADRHAEQNDLTR